MLPYLIFGITYGFAAAAQPGQFQAYVVSQSLANGWRRTFPVAFAPILSDMPIVPLAMFILANVPTLLIHLLQLAGGLFLLYLAAGAVTACRNYRSPDAAPASSAQQTVIKAAVVNLLNPNPYIGWALVMGPLLLKAWREAPANGIALVVSFYVTMIVMTLGIVLLFSAARTLGPRIARLLVGFSAAGLAGFGFYQLWSGTTALLYR